jgi:hypothetical protein
MGYSAPSTLTTFSFAPEFVASFSGVAGLSQTDSSFAALLWLLAGGPP